MLGWYFKRSKATGFLWEEGKKIYEQQQEKCLLSDRKLFDSWQKCPIFVTPSEQKVYLNFISNTLVLDKRVYNIMEFVLVIFMITSTSVQMF